MCDRRREVPDYNGSLIPNKFHHTCVRCSTLFSATMEAASSAANYSEPGSERHCPPDHYQRPPRHTRGVTNGRHSHPPPRTPRAVAEARAFAKQNDYCRAKSYFADDIYTRLYPIKTNLSWVACEYFPDPAVCSNATTATDATNPDQKCGEGAYVGCETNATSGQCVPKPEDAVTCPTPDPYLDDAARLIPSPPAWHSCTHTPPPADQRLWSHSPRHKH